MTRFLVPIVLLFACAVCAQPYQPHVIWDRSGLTDSSAYGYKILPLGDQNDDGYADWAVYAAGNGVQKAYLEFFHGSATLTEEPYYTYRADTILYVSGFAPVLLGDINGDGFSDWLVNLGRLPNGVIRDIGLVFGGSDPPNAPEWLLTVPYRSLPLAMGDFNGDGLSDVFFWNDQGDSLWCYYGGSPIDTIPDWVLRQPPPGINQTVPYAWGDFNGDGASDFLCYNPNPPYNAVVFLGGANPDTLGDYFWSGLTQPLGGVRSLNGDNADELLFSAANGADVHFGGDSLRPDPDTFLSSGAAHQAVSAGDFNHDGFNDLILLTPTTPSNMFGALDLHLGHAWLYPNPAFEIQGSWPDGLIGIYAATGLSDVNGDGIDDIAIGAWDDFAYLGWRGRCIIIAGDDSLIADAKDPRPEVPRELSIEAYPTPFNSQATIELETPLSQHLTSLTIYNVLGQSVRQETLPPFSGKYVYHFNAGDLPTGLYLVHVQFGDLQATQKLMLLK